MQGGSHPANVERGPVWLDRVTAPDLMLIWPEEQGWAQYIGALVTLDGRSLFDLSTEYQLTDTLQVYGKINNLLNTDPPMIANNATLKALGDSSSLYPEYDLGRVFGVGVRYTW